MTDAPSPTPEREGPNAFDRAIRSRATGLIGALLIGGLVGAVAGASLTRPAAEESSAYKAKADEVAALRSQIEDYADRESDIKEREDAIEAKESQLSDREGALVKSEAAMEDNTVSGDGVYLVGSDMKPGRYKSADNVDCYWKLSSDPNGDRIISNHLGDGNVFVEAKKGQYLTIEDCNDFTRQ